MRKIPGTRTCSVDGCTSKHNSHGYCENHLYRFKRYGDPLGGRAQYSREPDPEFSGLPESIWRRIEPTGFCWNWTGSTTRGYGRTKFADGHGSRIVHRVVYEALVGPIPEGLHLDHLCRNRACCNPDHLEPVDAAENSRRGWGPGGRNYRKTHCAQGHEYTPENTAVVGGWRKCRECHRRWSQEYREREKDAS